MYKIDVATAAVSLPTPAALGTEGFWTAGTPGVIPATVMDQDWFNALQGNLVGVLDAAGVTHSKSDYTKLTAAIKKLAGNQSQQLFSTPGSTNFTVPAGVYKLAIELWGGGGGGAGATAGSVGQAGAAGGYTTGIFAVTPGQVISMTVGAAGVNGAAGANNGTAGGSTSAGALCSATGGAGGVTSNSAANLGGGTGTGGTLNLIGGNGGVAASGTGPSGTGGSPPRGGVGGTGSAAQGAAGFFPGSGGGGGCNNNPGGLGSTGAILVSW